MITRLPLNDRGLRRSSGWPRRRAGRPASLRAWDRLSGRLCFYAAVSVLLAGIAVPLSTPARAAGDQYTRLVLTVNGARVDLSGESEVEVSDDGRYVAATVSLPPPNDGPLQVVLFDRTTGTTRLITHSDPEVIQPALPPIPASVLPKNGHSRGAHHLSLSRNGRYLVFTTNAGLAPGDGNNIDDVYLFDRVSGTLTPVVRGAFDRTFPEGSHHGVISADGSTIVFNTLAPLIGGESAAADGNGMGDYFVRRGTTKYRYVFSNNSYAHAKGWGREAASRLYISATGRYISYVCTCLPDGSTPEETSGASPRNVLRRDTRAARSTLVGRTSNSNLSQERLEFSMDGTGRAFVLFGGTKGPKVTADNSPDYIYRDLLNQRDSAIAAPPANVDPRNSSAMMRPPRLSGDGHVAVYVFENVLRADANPEYSANELYRWDATNGHLERVGAAPLSILYACQRLLNAPCVTGVIGRPGVSDHGDVIGFVTWDRLTSDDTDSSPDVYLAT